LKKVLQYQIIPLLLNSKQNNHTKKSNMKKEIFTNLTQKQAHKILVRNNHFCGGKIPFDKTTNYVGMLIETNTHRRIWNAKELY